VYEAEEVRTEVKVEVVDPTRYLMLDAPLTRSKHKAIDQLEDPYRQHRRALSTTVAPHSSPSVSKKMAMRHRPTTSGPISTPLTLL
jgi:hypothetical protein